MLHHQNLLLLLGWSQIGWEPFQKLLCSPNAVVYDLGLNPERTLLDWLVKPCFEMQGNGWCSPQRPRGRPKYRTISSRSYTLSKPDAAASYAKRFAAKEACAKALGTGLRRGVFWRDMGVVNLRSGQPTLALTGGAADRLAELTPQGHRAVIHLSMTDDHPYAQAFVIIEATPIA